MGDALGGQLVQNVGNQGADILRLWVVASNYEEGITGGVHNMFATEDHLFALAGGDKYVIIDVRDLDNPRSALTAYMAALEDEDKQVRTAAAIALAGIGGAGKQVAPILVQALPESDPMSPDDITATFARRVSLPWAASR